MSEHDERELLADLAQGRLSAADRARVGRHVEDCSDCQAWSSAYQWFRDALDARGEAADSAHPPSEALSRLAVFPQESESTALASLTAHLSECSECREVLEITRAALAEVDRKSGPTRGWGPRIGLAISPRQILALAATLVVLLVGLALVTLRGTTPSLPDDLTFSDDFSGRTVVEAQRSITATASRVRGGADVTFRAGKTVVLGDGFSVEEGATFAVEVPIHPPPREPGANG